MLRRRHARKALRLARLLAELETGNGRRRSGSERARTGARVSVARG